MTAVQVTAPLAAAIVDWSGLGQVVLFAVVTGLVLVGAFSVGVVGLDNWSKAHGGADAGDSPNTSTSTSPTSISDAAMPVGVSAPMVTYGSLAMAVVGFGICVIGVLIGLFSMVHR